MCLNVWHFNFTYCGPWGGQHQSESLASNFQTIFRGFGTFIYTKGDERAKEEKRLVKNSTNVAAASA